MNFRTAGAVLIPGYHLAVRNCPWVCRFWLGLVRGMERNKSSHEEIVGGCGHGCNMISMVVCIRDPLYKQTTSV